VKIVTKNLDGREISTHRGKGSMMTTRPLAWTQEQWFYCPGCGAVGTMDDLLTGNDCCIGVVYEEA